MSIKDRYKDDRPREKLAKFGAAKLSDLELLMAVIGSGNAQAGVEKIARDVLKIVKNQGAAVDYAALRAVTGLGEAKIAVLLANFELARRYLLESDRPVIDSPDKAVAELAEFRAKQQEYFICLTLDGANRLINKRVISIGTLTASLVHPREVFADAITDRAASIIVAHNHPSGSLKPSPADLDITQRLKQAGEIIGIELIDHLILTIKQYKSIL